MHEEGTDGAAKEQNHWEGSTGVYPTRKFSRGVEHFYPVIQRQENENKRVSVGFWGASVKDVGETSRGSL